MCSPTRFLPLAALGLAVAAASQQRPVTDISGNTGTCQEAVVSPDGQAVAYRTGNRIAVVGTSGGAETTAASGAALGSFLWSVGGTTLFLVDGNRVIAAPRSGGGGVTIGTIPGQSVVLWDVDNAGTKVFGTRYDPAATRYHVFELPTSGMQPHTDLFDSQDVISDLRVDPSDRYLLYLQRGTAPFSPISVMRANFDGTGQLDMLGAPLGTVALGIDWVDAGDRAIVTTVPAATSLQVMRIDRTTQTVEPLTWTFQHRNTSVSPDGRWIVMESQDGVGGNGPALLPTEGGGEILLHTGQRYVYAGAPTADGVGRHVAFSAQRTGVTENPRVLRIDLDDEMRVYPRAEIGQPLNFALPVGTNEIGAILLGRRSAPFTLSGIQWDYDLGADFAILAVAPGGTSGMITTAVAIPALQVLQGLVVDFQGLRWDPVSTSGEWTRSGRFPIF